MTEQGVKARFLTKDAVIGWVALSTIIAMAIVGFQFITNRNSGNDILASDPEQIPRISAAELKSKMDSASNLVVIDVRSKEEYENIHITGSISLPLEEINQRYNDLKGYEQVVTYCTWQNEGASARAALILRQLGLPNVKPLLGGLAAWQEAGYPVDGTEK